jgi:hypothetical protein
MKDLLTYIILVIIISAGCKEKYTAPEIGIGKNFLVVDGMIVNGDTSLLILSRSRNVNTKEAVKYETAATVTLEGESGGTFNFQNKGNGRYFLNTITLNTASNYRLRIKTSGKEYLSDLFPVKQTPPVDSIGYKLKPNGLELFANTHDPLNKTRYYKWEFVETWQYSPKHQSFYEFKVDTILQRPIANYIYNCWMTVNSSSVAIATSVNLTNDVISEAPLIFIEDTSARVMTRYSVLVKQYGITEDAYHFWENVKKTSETLGSFFDAQPTQLSTNIHCLTTPEEPVIGYISAASVTQKRIFIDRLDLPNYFKFPFPSCIADTMPRFLEGIPPNLQAQLLKDRVKVVFGDGSQIPILNIVGSTGWNYSTKECVDCRTKGGTLVKPSFW